MLTRLLALLAVLLLAPASAAHANARALSLESASLGFFTANRDFLKEIPGLTHCCIKEKSTWQAESSNRRGEYLRARYMDPGQGRFLGMDPWSGDINTPMSLHRYAYAQGQVANRIDPSGNASRADDLLQALTIQAFLATAATVVIRAIVPIESDRRPDRGVTAADAVAISYFKANIDTSQILAATTTATSMIEDEHHTIPVYICGHPDQDLSRLYRRDHFLIHAQIGAVKFAIERAEDLTTHTFRLGRRRSPEGWLLASTQAGRIAIAGALDAVYVLGGWLTTGSPPIGEIYFGAAGATGEKQKFIAGHTSWPFCVRP